MEAVFLKVLNMSVAACWLTAVVILVRFCLRRAPKWISCLLWAFVAVRLVCPFVLESRWSLIPEAVGSGSSLKEWEESYVGDIRILHDASADFDRAVQSGLESVPAGEEGSYIVAAGDGTGQPETVGTAVIPILARIWMAGACLLFFHAVLSYLRLSRTVRERVPAGDEICGEGTFLREKIFWCDTVSSPFILGLVRPEVYLPAGMEPGSAALVIAHERAHLRRLDHFWKPVGFLILALHWFNPFCWIAYILFCRDIELACDEKVVSRMDLAEKKAYSGVLLECSGKRRLVTVCPLAFGEVGVAERIKCVLDYKRPTFWIIVTGVVICVWVAASFLTNPVSRYDYGKASEVGQSEATEEYKQASEVGQPETAEEYKQASGAGQPETAEEYKQASEVGQPETAEEHKQALVVGEKEEEKRNPLETAITEAILKHNDWKYPSRNFDCESHIILASEDFEIAGDTGNSKEDGVTDYAVALYQGYAFSDRGISEVRMSYVPVALTFEVTDDGGYDLKEYWTPRDGAFYVPDILGKFPENIVPDVIDMQKYSLGLKQACYAQAVESGGVDADRVIKRLLEKIMSSPEEASKPADYIDAHSLEYRELTWYGDYALRYCYREFLKGGQTGLCGHIMRILMDDLQSEEIKLRLYTETGQEYFDVVLKIVEKMCSENGELWMREYMPHGWMLHEMKLSEG